MELSSPKIKKILIFYLKKSVYYALQNFLA